MILQFILSRSVTAWAPASRDWLYSQSPPVCSLLPLQDIRSQLPLTCFLHKLFKGSRITYCEVQGLNLAMWLLKSAFCIPLFWYHTPFQTHGPRAPPCPDDTCCPFSGSSFLLGRPFIAFLAWRNPANPLWPSRNAVFSFSLESLLRPRNN